METKTAPEKKLRCQSCGMVLSSELFGTNSDGSENKEYCKFCFLSGVFTEPNLTLQDMLKKSIHQLEKKGFSEEQAETMTPCSHSAASQVAIMI